MYFNHQLHYSVTTASSIRERLFFFFWICFIFNPSKIPSTIFVGTERETERENTSKTKAVLRRFSDSLVNFLLEWGQPHTFRFAHRFFLRQSGFFWIFCTSKGVIYRSAYDEYSNRHAPDYIFKNGIATRYGGNIKDLSS